jgi:hypothetical protein
MTHQGRKSGGPTPTSWNRGPTILLTACGAVATAAYLGASWLRTPMAGLPTGVWAVAITQAAAYAWWRRSQRPSAFLRDTRAIDTVDVRLLAGPTLAWAARTLDRATAGLPVGRAGIENLRSRVGDGLDAGSWPSAPLRIGIDMTAESGAALMDAMPEDVAAEWIPVCGDDQRTLERHRLDVIVRQTPGEPMRITTREDPSRPAAWQDWSIAPALSFGSVFPGRIDPARITLDHIDLNDDAEGCLAASLVQAAGVLSRCAHRLGLEDRLCGRMPTDAISRRGVTLTTTECTKAMKRLGDVMLAARGAREATPAQRAAARAVSAYFGSGDAKIGIETRVLFTRAATEILAEEPEPLLRAAAMRFAACDDLPAIGMLMEAESLMRERCARPAGDQLPFLQAELELGLPGPFTLGRVAAGIAIVCATSPAERLAYVRGDVMDDARYSSWLVGRDQDRAALAEVFRRLEQGRFSMASVEPKFERAVA